MNYANYHASVADHTSSGATMTYMSTMSHASSATSTISTGRWSSKPAEPDKPLVFNTYRTPYILRLSGQHTDTTGPIQGRPRVSTPAQRKHRKVKRKMARASRRGNR